MSDVSFVCVSADLDLAETLADLFGDAGLTVGDVDEPSSAAILVWSDAAQRSRAFLREARRATEEGRAIIVSTMAIAPEASENVAVFDLSSWNGAAGSALIDPLFVAVDRKVIAASWPAITEPGEPHVVDDEAVEAAGEETTSAAPFAPPRVQARFAAWRKPNLPLDRTLGVLGLIAVLGAGALAVGLTGTNAEPAAPEARAAIASEVATLPESAAAHVTFAEAVLDDPVFDDIAPAAPPPEWAGRGREPPSASSVRGARGTPAPLASWRDASYSAERDPVIRASYRPVGAATSALTPQSESGKPHAKAD